MLYSESKDEAFTRDHLVISLYHDLTLEVRGIGGELCLPSRRR